MQDIANKAALKTAMKAAQNRKSGAAQRREALEAITTCALYNDDEKGRLARLYLLGEHGTVIPRPSAP